MQPIIHPGSLSPNAETLQQPLVAIVILNWNGKKFLEQFLPSVFASTYANKRIIVADNASTDDSLTFIQEKFPSTEILVNVQNEGFAKGYNNILKRVEADYYVLLNSDVEVDAGWIEPIIKLMEADKLIAACQPKLLAFIDKHKFEYAGASGGWMDKFGYPFMRGRIFDYCENDNGQYNDRQQCFWASGAAMFVRKKAWDESGGFDEYFFAHQEEIDLCWRLQLMGYKIFVEPASVVYHVGGGTLPKGNSRKTYLNFRNNLVMLYKNIPWQRKWWLIPFRIGLDIIAALRTLISGDTGYCVAVFKAHLHFIGWMLFQKNKSVFPKTKKGGVSGWYTGSIVWDHFIKKKQTFLEIIAGK